MSKKLITLIIVFMLIQNIIFKNIYLPILSDTWDEIFEIFVFFIFIIENKSKHTYKIKKNKLTPIIIIFTIIIIGLLSNINNQYVISPYFIIKDIVSFLKFPALYLILYDILKEKNIYTCDYKFLNYIINILIIIIFIFGIISTIIDLGLTTNGIRFGIKPYQFLFSHPTYLVLSLILMLSIHEKIKNNSHKIDLYEILVSISVILTMRTKGIITISLYLFIKYFKNSLKKLKIIYILSILLIIFFTSNNKINEYKSYSTSAREVFYTETLTLLKNNFPIGSGFATYASHVSYQAKSKIYDFIKIPIYYVNGKEGIAVYGDTGYPYYIGQFGILGFALIIILFYKLYKISISKEEDIDSVNLIWIYIIIALTSESILLNNGIELAYILAFLTVCTNKLKKGKEQNI